MFSKFKAEDTGVEKAQIVDPLGLEGVSVEELMLPVMVEDEKIE
jgi:hypothetical protein